MQVQALHGRTARSSPTARLKGFTLIEMLAVAAVVSIIALVVNMNLAPAEPYQIELTATEMALAFRYARSEAIRTSNPHGVHIESGVPRLRLVHDNTGTIPPVPAYDVYQPISKQPYEVNLTNLGGGPRLTNNPLWSATCNQADFLYFDAAGRPRCGNPWGVLLSSSTLTLEWSGHARSVNIDGETGRVTLQ